MVFNIDFTKYRIVDLSYEIIPNHDEFGTRPFETTMGLLPDNADTEVITNTHSHVGTHVEVQRHWIRGAKGITDYPITHYMGRGVLWAFRQPANSRRITVDDIDKGLGKTMQPGDFVFCRNDAAAPWDRLDEWPILDFEIADWLVQKGTKILCTQGILMSESWDIEASRRFEGHLMHHEVGLIELTSDLKQLQQQEFYVLALPIKVRGFGSSWIRLIAIEEI